MADAKRQSVREQLWLALLAVGLPVLAVLQRAFDANWDLKNYHLYNPHAWLTGRMQLDVAPAMLQTWHNPLLDVPLYWIVQSGLDAGWARAWLTLPCIASIFLLLKLQRLLSDAAPTPASQFALALLVVTGAAAYSTLGTSTNDGFVAAGVLCSLVLAMGSDGADRRRWLLAGFVAGAITGLKLSAAFYCVALGLASMAAGSLPERLRRATALAVGGVAGFALSYGYWGWTLFKRFGNPFFPYYNQIFHSPAALSLPYADARFRPQTFLDALLAPIHLLTRSQRFSELPLRDPRLLLGIACLLALWLAARKRPMPDGGQRSRIATLLVFFLAAFGLWVLQYGIYRYAIALEMLGTLALLLLLQRVPRRQNLVLALAVLLVSADTKRPDWYHVPSHAPRLGIVAPPIPRGSLVLMAGGEPLAYLALGLPGDVPLVSVSDSMMNPDNCTLLQERARRMIASNAGPIWVLSGSKATLDASLAILGRHYGLRANGKCSMFASSFGGALLCPLERGSSADRCHAPASLTLELPRMVACAAGVTGDVRWDAAAATPAVAVTQLWVTGNGREDWKLFNEGGPTGVVATGPWNVPGVRYQLRERDSGRPLASATVDGPRCADAR